MKFKKTFLIVCIIICLFSVSLVSAGDEGNQTIAGADDVELSQNSEIDGLQKSFEKQIVGGNDDGTFHALQDKINNAAEGSTLNLENDYSYEGTGFSEGIVISRANIVIDGRGHTIDARNEAGIFKVQAENVTLKNMIFTNGHVTNGGAIHWFGSSDGCVLDCTFINNTANKGGAIYWSGSSGGSVSGCSFLNNSAGAYGGAIYWYDSSSGCVSGCSFVGNTAAYGAGAIYWSVSSGGCVSGCSFVNNIAKGSDGGAIYWSVSSGGSVSGCSFLNNSAGAYGGAIYWYDSSGGCVSGCSFVNNIAKGNNGGAIFWSGSSDGYISLCRFTNNTANYGGGAIYRDNGGDVSADSCIYITGSDTADFTLNFAPNLSADNFTSSYRSGERLTFNLTTNRNAPITNADITIEIYKNNTLYGTYHCLSGEGWTADLPVGSYDAVIKTEFAGLSPLNRTVTINRMSSKIILSPTTAVYSKDKYLIVSLRDVNDEPVGGVQITVNLNGAKTYVTDRNGQAKVNIAKLHPKTYDAVITFENDNYHPSKSSFKVTVKKATPKLTAKKKTFKAAKKIKKYTVVLKSGKTPIKKAKLTLKIKGKKFKAKTNAKGKATFKIRKLTKKGKYGATVTFKANKYYKKVTKKVKIRIK